MFWAVKVIFFADKWSLSGVGQDYKECKIVTLGQSELFKMAATYLWNSIQMVFYWQKVSYQILFWAVKVYFFADKWSLSGVE